MTFNYYCMSMKLIAFFCLANITALSSCSGQPVSKAPDKLIGTAGDTVKSLVKNIMQVFQDSKGIYWFGSWESGLYKYNGNCIIHYTVKDGLPGNRVEEIKEDKAGNICINTDKGLCLFSQNRFNLIQVITESDWSLEQDDLWFKCLENSDFVYRYNGEKLYRLKLPETDLGKEYVTKHPNYPNPYGIYCIYKDSRHNIWFGTAVLGAFRYNGKSFDWISEDDLTEIHDGPSNGVRSICEDKNGDFWFNTSYRYSIYNKNDGNSGDTGNPKFYKRIKSIGSLNGINGNLNKYLSIIKDDHNNLWMATYLQGVWQYNGSIIMHHTVRNGLMQIPVYCLYKDNQGNIWLGTHENGVYRFNGSLFEAFKP